MPHSLMQKINSFALRSFRDTADKDYIHARMAYRAGLFPQFHWSALHALEKYAKCILILTRIPKPTNRDDFIGHEVKKSLILISNVLDFTLSEQTTKFIDRLEKFGAKYRYLEVSWFIKDCELAILDRAVWELRRYCNAEIYEYSDNSYVSVKNEKYKQIKLVDKPTKINTRISGGFIEKSLENLNSSARPDLIWNNLYYSNSNRKSVSIKKSTMAENSPFHLHPEIIDEVSKYIFVPREFRNAYKNG
ncbi:hypothetical protein L3081_09485 [Colwellia sp. MSW7]|uniref:HEPN domain-containing protein n=1 Tax=Colwellia maritima TaxID=2912588 RepID=A0ABS9X004_9GAMM|nr:hypothetical protein [Colwellia maritima]MCI2283578.1 hypothetical protein [Colwellia maritima]